MTYDADGLRSTKTVGTRKFEYQYVGDKLFFEKRGDNQEFYYFYDSYGNLSMIYYTLVGSNGTTSRAVYHAVTNAQGDVIALHKQNGDLVARYEYDAWGNTLSVTDADGNAITTWYHIANSNPIRYRGYYYDADLGLYYLQSRYYDSEIGRFINADGYITTGQGVMSYNMYSYCQNNPVMFSDPSGNSLIGALIGIAVAIIFVVGLGGCSKPSKNTPKKSPPPTTPSSNNGHSSKDDLTSQQMHENAEFVYEKLSSKGWSHNAICAVLGNMQHESISINPGKWQNGGGTGYGIVQWDPASKYLNWASANGYTEDSLEGQVEYLDFSMQPGNGEWFRNSNYPNMYLSYSDYICSNSSVAYLTEVFVWSYERPGVVHMDSRIQCAEYWNSYFG